MSADVGIRRPGGHQIGEDPAERGRELERVSRTQSDGDGRMSGHRIDDEVPVRRQRVQARHRVRRGADAGQQAGHEPRQPGQRPRIGLERPPGRRRAYTTAVLSRLNQRATPALGIGRKAVERWIVHPDPHGQPVGAEVLRSRRREVGHLLAEHRQGQRCTEMGEQIVRPRVRGENDAARSDGPAPIDGHVHLTAGDTDLGQAGDRRRVVEPAPHSRASRCIVVVLRPAGTIDVSRW
jgi:hypothetical protein